MASRPDRPRRVFRICKNLYPILDREGAARYPGRWNRLGQRVIYAAETYAGAMLEILVHANLNRPPRGLHAAAITIPKAMAVEAVTGAQLPGWDAADREASRAFGAEWYEQGRSGRRAAVLVVPSVVVRPERNILINPEHPDFRRIRAAMPEAVQWDPRLLPA